MSVFSSEPSKAFLPQVQWLKHGGDPAQLPPTQSSDEWMVFSHLHPKLLLLVEIGIKPCLGIVHVPKFNG